MLAEDCVSFETAKLLKEKMTLDDAIKHANDVANSCDNKECAYEHYQLARWLEELKMYRETYR